MQYLGSTYLGWQSLLPQWFFHMYHEFYFQTFSYHWKMSAGRTILTNNVAKDRMITKFPQVSGQFILFNIWSIPIIPGFFIVFFLNLLWILQKQALHSIADFYAYQTNCFMFDSGVLLRAVKNHWTVYEIDLFLFCEFNRMIWFVLIAVIRDQMFLL